MIELLRIVLEAHNVGRNHHRRYELTVGRDLLGDWLVCIHYGRAGHKLRAAQFASDDIGDAQRDARMRLRRRLSAPGRIGCAYKVMELSTAPGLSHQEWMPEQIESVSGPGPARSSSELTNR